MRLIILSFAAFVLLGCASIDFNYPRVESSAMVDTDDTSLGRRYAERVSAKPVIEVGIYPLLSGLEAFTARLVLAANAERSIDTQYYLLRSDPTGIAFVGSLLRAADRGVRVRLLLDDMYTGDLDIGMAVLDSHPNFEIRVFNPFNRGAMGRAWSGITDLGRINRRMHTKTFTVDNQLTIIGGRNIADEYFGAKRDEKFGDLDVLGVGNLPNDVSRMFDLFWNHETAIPVLAFLDPPKDATAELENLRRQLVEFEEQSKGNLYRDTVVETGQQFLDDIDTKFQWAPYQLVYDSPDKGIKSAEGPEVAIALPLGNALQTAKKQIIVLSPYFVPRKSGIKFFSDLQSRGVDVTIITNSLAANNHAGVHGGYMPSRKPLLNNGVRMFEVRPDAKIRGAELFAASGAKATMHTKAFLVDDSEVFVGSFNFDPRSLNLNTESGVLLQSPELARTFNEFAITDLEKNAYELYLNDDGDLRWRSFENGTEVIYEREPQSTWKQRFFAGFMRFVPIKSQL